MEDLGGKTWKRFVLTHHGSLVREFFYKLNAEIAGISGGSGREDARTFKRKGVLLLNTKKGYWMYKVFEREEPNVQLLEVISDRYVKKLMNFSFFQDKIVYLVDDTLTNGFSLYETYELLAGFMEEEYILPIVFALNESVNLDSLVRGSSGTRARFWEKLRYSVRMTAEDMGYFCVEETKLLHNEKIPYVMDLPYLKDKSDSNIKMKYEVILTKEVFQSLVRGNELWKFHSNFCKAHGDCGEVVLQGFIIQLMSEELIKVTRQYISDYTIEGTYQIDKDGKVHMVFTPFALAKSVGKEELGKLWRTLVDYKKADYEFGMQDNSVFKQNIFVKQYRECEYVLSMVVGELFRKYFKGLSGIDLCYDYQVLEEHFQSEFIERVKEIEQQGEVWLEAIRRKLVTLSGSEGCLDREIQLRNAGLGSKLKVTGGNEKYSENSAYFMVVGNVINKRIHFLTSASGDNRNRNKRDAVLETGEVAELLEKRFEFTVENEKRYAHSRIMTTLIQSSIGGTQVLISQDGTRAEKVIRYGENSDLLLPFFDLNFYWAVILRVEKLGREKALQHYEYFVKNLKDRFIEWGLYKKKITVTKFKANEAYYKSILENNLQLYNKYFFLYPYFRGELDEEETYYLKKIEDFVANITY